MKNVKWMLSPLCSLVFSLFLIAGLSANLAAQADADSAAKAAAADWLASMDAADYAATWNSAAAMFKSAIAADAWAQAAKAARGPLGALQSRADKSLTMAASLPGVPDGNYAVIQYDTAFANKAASVETLTLALEDGQWKVAGYFIK